LETLNATTLDVFGREVIYSPSNGEGLVVQAIVETTREMEEAAPGVYAVLFLRLKDLPQPPERGDVVSIDGRDYKVFDIEADGGGGALIRLRQI
jgi:hypothetical protein